MAFPPTHSLTTMTAPRLNLSDAVDDLAPSPPPCFENRHIWRDYLKSSAAVQYAKGEQRVILVTAKREPRFNPAFNFCLDCDERTMERKKAKGVCDPEHITKELTPA